MRIRKKITYQYMIVFLFLINLIAGGVIPLGEEPSKDLIKLSLSIINIVAVFFLGIKIKDSNIIFFYFFIAFILFIPSLLRTEELIYAIGKLDAILLSVPFSTIILLSLYNKIGLSETVRLIVKSGFLLLILTVIYKLKFGFWDRNTRYFLNGANVFGWLMGFYFLSSIHIFSLKKSKVYFFLALCFFLGVLWSESKGSLLSSILCFLIIIVTQFETTKIKLFIFSVIGFFIFFKQETQSYLQDYFPDSRLLAVFRIFSGDLQESDEGSVGIRSDLLTEATSFFIDQPITGIGLGNFKAYSIHGFDYPHNGHIEVFSENGLIVGIVYLAFILYGVVISKGFLRIVIIYFLIVCSFSGDLSYLRFSFVFILLASCIHNKLKDSNFKHNSQITRIY